MQRMQRTCISSPSILLQRLVAVAALHLQHASSWDHTASPLVLVSLSCCYNSLWSAVRSSNAAAAMQQQLCSYRTYYLCLQMVQVLMKKSPSKQTCCPWQQGLQGWCMYSAVQTLRLCVAAYPSLAWSKKSWRLCCRVMLWFCVEKQDVVKQHRLVCQQPCPIVITVTLGRTKAI